MIQGKSKGNYDAVVVGSGPNGLAAAITLQRAGLSVLILEGKEEIGGGMRSAELTLPGYVHDICSAIHPLAVGSPFFQTLPLAEHGLEYVYPEVEAAHPFDDGTAAVLSQSIESTASGLGIDRSSYLDLMRPVTSDWPFIVKNVLGPLRFPDSPFRMAAFGLRALPSAINMAKRFTSKEARGLWAGMAAHSMQSLSSLATSAVALVLLSTGHVGGWPIPIGGSKEIANSLASYFLFLGGTIETGFYVDSLSQLPWARAVLLDLTPRQLLQLGGDRFSDIYKSRLRHYRYGMGVFKIDWALSEQIPFTAPQARMAGTVHIGNTLEEIAQAEHMVAEGKHPERPFVLLAQQSLFDNSRAPAGRQTAWAYCHVPNGSTKDMTEAIERQVERFAPGFRDCILARSSMNSSQLEAYNPNYIGGDINGGIADIKQLFTRPILSSSPYRTSEKGIYICSSSTPPGGGVHGMCGFHAARRALRDIFQTNINL